MPSNDEIRQLPIVWAKPYEYDKTGELVGRREEFAQCMAAWGIHPETLAPLDGARPLHFRLEGPPGVGKNEVVIEIARKLAYVA